MMHTTILRHHRRVAGTGTGARVITDKANFIPALRAGIPNKSWPLHTIKVEEGRRSSYTRRMPSFPLQIAPSPSQNKVLHLALKTAVCKHSVGVVFGTCDADSFLSTFERTFTRTKRRWLSKSSSTEEGNLEKKLFSEGRSGKITTSRPLNYNATKAIISQLSSPANMLTMSRIIATPYLSYMIISENRKSNISPSAILGGDMQHAAYSSPITADTAVNLTINVSADATSTIFANLNQLSTPEISLLLFLLMGFTDFLDGYIARAYPSTATVLGTYLDPFADKFFISILSLTMWYIGNLPGPLVGLWIARDVGIVGSVYWLVRSETIRKQSGKRLDENGSHNNNVAIMDPETTPLKVQASFTSKVNTSLQIALIALGIAGEVPSIDIPPMWMTSLIWITAGTTILSSLGYLDGSAMKNTGNK